LQKTLFNTSDSFTDLSPLAHKLRPKVKKDFFGIDELEKRYPFLMSPKPKSMIFYGPPGCGKTTLAHVLCVDNNIDFFPFSAVLSGVGELKKLFQSAKDAVEMHQRTPVIFVDEIHRFNRAQQDALLPHVERGQIILIGATTENPKSSINRALLSRLKIVELKAIDYECTVQILTTAIDKLNTNFSDGEVNIMAEYSGGDARKAITNLEMAIELKENNQFSIDAFKSLILENARSYDRNKDRHYDVISAYIKSMRGSDPDAALLWLAVMLDGGEDPVFIARRLVIFSSEDVGNADLNALSVANNTLQVVSNIGMPEARITLAQATTYLASTVKSNAAYTAINEALDYVKSNPTIEVPEHLKNFPIKTNPVKYQYPHLFEGGWVEQQYSPPDTPQFYKPKRIGVEKKIIERLKKLWSKKNY
jgi:putative ATPase